jgi:hypothetical protein
MVLRGVSQLWPDLVGVQLLDFGIGVGQLGWADMSRATAPVTCGAAMLVCEAEYTAAAVPA